MLIGLISDTHIPDHAKELPLQLKEVFRGVELILHAGDIYIPAVLDELELIAPVLASEGDDDPFAIKNDKRVKWHQAMTIEGVTIHLMHDKLWASLPRPEGLPKTINSQNNGHPDVIVYGHTHSSTLERRNGLLLVNPGSATFPHYKRVPGTVGLLKVDSGHADVEIIQLQ
ncbi:MAG: metallophosphoesterase family protein [Chloroflexi bacterium]|nr:metallophosphoesterase family protein [Chloroflexota bacterium]